MSPAAVKKFGINFLQLTISAATVCGIIMGILWTYAKPYVVTEIDTRMKENNEWIRVTYFSKIDDLKRELNVDEVKKANSELLKELTDVRLQMVELKTEMRMMRK
jgi:hypothetical protein